MHAKKKLGRVFVCLSGPKSKPQMEGKRYTMIIRDDFTRFTWLKVIRETDSAAEALKKCLAHTRTHGDIEIVRSDEEGEVRGRFSEVSVDH